jgi:hypothetical protein
VRNVQQLFETEIRNGAVALPLDDQRTLIVPRHLCAQQLELGDRTYVLCELRLLEDSLGLVVRRLGDRDETVCERRIVVRLCDVENDLRALSGELDVR